MKKLIAITLALLLCVGLLSFGASAAGINYITVTGTMNGWDPASEADRMTPNPAGSYTITYENMPAGNYEFKFTANGNWDDLNLGGSFMGSDVWAPLYWSGSNICFTVEEATDVTIMLDLENYEFKVCIGERVDEAPEAMVLHISVPESWGATYAYVWGPEHLGFWPGTLAEDGEVSVTAAFEGMVINNGSGTQSWDITDIDLTQSEVWITVSEDGSYTLSYENPNQGGDPVDPPVVSNIKVHVIAPESWETVYAYTFNPEQTGTWPGTLISDGVIEVPASFEGLIINNGVGSQTGDIKDIDLTAEEVWVVVAEDCSYALFYNEADVVLPTPPATIKINIVAEHWTNVYAYTFNPASCGNWPGTLVENGSIEVLASFEGLVLNNGEGQQTADIIDIDLTQAEVWITVNADNSYTLSYEAPVVDVPGVDPVGPETGDAILPGVLVLLLSLTGIVMLTNKKHD